jgi:A/G-specific adenine glycosylase
MNASKSKTARTTKVPSVPSEACREVTRLRPALLRWFDRHARGLPWRKPYKALDVLWPEKTALRRNPYATWVAEIMLQQTQVVTVIPYFEKWLRRFPDPVSLASAPEEEVLRHWAGLGYYARARNLHRGAQVLVTEAGRYPVTAAGWRALPGIGPYTAGAVASLAFDLPEPILDGNVIRVLSRVFGLAFLPGEGREYAACYWELAALWPQGSRPGDTNEALMELGALVCTPASPRCGECPLAAGCRAKKQGWQNTLPPAKPRSRIESVAGVALVIENRGRILFEVRPAGSFLAGHNLFPLFLGEEEKEWAHHLGKRFPSLRMQTRREAGVVRHSIMNCRYLLRVLHVTLSSATPNTLKSLAEIKWMTGTQLEKNLTNSLARKIWKRVVAEN